MSFQAVLISMVDPASDAGAVIARSAATKQSSPDKAVQSGGVALDCFAFGSQ